MRKLEDDFDLENATCEKHPGKKWPHKVFGLRWDEVGYQECAGPGIPKPRKVD